MNKIYTNKSTRKHIRGFEHFLYGVFSTLLVLVLLVLPVAPVFADELTAILHASTKSLSEAPVAAASEKIVAPEIVQTKTDASKVTIEPASLSVDAEPAKETAPVQTSVKSTTAIPTPTTTQKAIVESTSVSNTPVPISTTDNSTATKTENGSTTLVVVKATTTITLANATAQTPTTSVSNTTSTTTQTAVEKTETSISTEAIALGDFNTISAPSNANTVLATETIRATTSNDVNDDPLYGPRPEAVNIMTDDDNRFTFSKDQCTLVGDGTFYCAKAEKKIEVTNTDRVFAAPDSTGDKEIFVEKNGKLTQITYNDDEDDAPFFDRLSNELTWHRLINGRYQIVTYSFDTKEETQVTFDRYNNMYPNKYGDVAVWQGWVGEDWEIFMLAGDELTMLTDNITHDISPHINGTHIIWQSFENNAWVMKVYDMRTKSTETVHGNDGGSIENPRFVLVYDTKYDSGDVETRGYDLESGEILKLNSEPARVPNTIPDPDQTGEKRALVSPSAQPKIKGTLQGIDTDSDDNSATATTTDVSDDDLVIPLLGRSTTTPSGDGATATTTGNYDDVVIPAFENGSSTTKSEIEDLVITPLIEPIVEIEDVIIGTTSISTPV